MTKPPTIEAPRDQLPQDEPKVRKCLGCKVMFNSAWAGERICSRCKSSAAWQDGTPVKSYPSGGRR